MNSLTEAIGLSLPRNGTIVATNAERKKLFKEAGKRIVENCKRYYGPMTTGAPRSIATKDAFETRCASASPWASNTVPTSSPSRRKRTWTDGTSAVLPATRPASASRSPTVYCNIHV